MLYATYKYIADQSNDAGVRNKTFFNFIYFFIFILLCIGVWRKVLVYDPDGPSANFKLSTLSLKQKIMQN